MTASQRVAPAKLPEDLFVGRTDELSILNTRIQRAIGGQGSICFVIGEAGVGKSRLISESLRLARDDNVLVLEAGNIPDASGSSFGVWIDLMREYGERVGWVVAREIAGSHAPNIVRFAPKLLTVEDEFTGNVEEISASVVPPGSAEIRVLASIRFFFREACKRRPIIIRIEDTQNIDKRSIELLHALCGSIEHIPLCVICEIRRQSDSENDSISAALSEFHRYSHVERIYLGNLSRTDTQAITQWWFDRPLAQSVIDELHRFCGGNALYTTQLLRNLPRNDETKHLDILSRYKETGLPGILRSLVRERTSRMPGPTRRVLYVTALLGYEFRIDVLSATSLGWEDPEPFDSLDRLTDLGLVTRVERSEEIYRFVHELVREAVISEIPIAMKLEFHARIAEAYQSATRIVSDRNFRAIYRHTKGSACTDDEKISDIALRAGNEAFESYSFRDAERVYREGLESATRCENNARIAEYHAALARVCSYMESVEIAPADTARDHLIAAIELFIELEDPEALSRLIRFPEVVMSTKDGFFTDIAPFDKLVSYLPAIRKRMYCTPERWHLLWVTPKKRFESIRRQRI